MEVVFSPKCLEYEFPGHPESPDRVESTWKFLREKGEVKFLEPETCPERLLLTVHTRNLVEKVKTGKFSDPDTPASPEMFDYARLSAGAAVKAAELALKGKGTTFSLFRPPGHHAGRDSLGGFCYFNNMALAVEFLRDREGSKVAVLDIDSHHGNGSQNIFLERNGILYVSLHQEGIFPGTGNESSKNCLNFPLPPGTGEEKYLEALNRALERIEKFQPEILGISAGFDTYSGDPLTGIQLEKKSYRKIGKRIKELELPTFSVLEGGYSPELKYCIWNFLEGIQ